MRNLHSIPQRPARPGTWTDASFREAWGPLYAEQVDGRFLNDARHTQELYDAARRIAREAEQFAREAEQYLLRAEGRPRWTQTAPNAANAYFLTGETFTAEDLYRTQRALIRNPLPRE